MMNGLVGGRARSSSVEGQLSRTSQPRLQIALDTTDLPTAFRSLQQVAHLVDVIEVGTVLILSEGLRAVREIRALFPALPLVADVRIAEAGSIIARLAYEAGANWVSVVAGASLATVEQVCNVAREFDGEVQIELGDHYHCRQAQTWRQLGVEHVIVHRSRDVEASGRLAWSEENLDRIDELAAMGFTVTVTGGMTAAELPVFAGRQVGVVIAGRALLRAESPALAAAELRQTLAEVWT
jgi:3-dehydro-L-gulonate-6-phosphate decarboxylase